MMNIVESCCVIEKNPIVRIEFISVEKVASNDNNYTKIKYDSIDYKIGQKVRNYRLKRRYTQKDLANKIGITYRLVLQHEKGNRRISIEKLYEIAKALSVDIRVLLPESTVMREKSSFEDEKLKLIRRYKKIKSQEIRKTVCLLAKSIQMSEESIKREERIEVARNLNKEGVSIEMIFEGTGLTKEEYDEKEMEEESIYRKIGRRIKELRSIREYTQSDLARKIGTAQQIICDYEQGNVAMPFERLNEIAKALAVNIEDLLPESGEEDDYEDRGGEEDNRAENEVFSLIREYKKIDNQELREGFNKFLSEGMILYEEKIRKAEKIKIARNLIKAGVSVKIICKATGLDDDEFDG